MKVIAALVLALVFVAGHAVVVDAAKLRKGDRVVVDREGKRFDGRKGTVVRVGRRGRVRVALDRTPRQRRARPRPPRVRRWFARGHLRRARAGRGPSVPPVAGTGEGVLLGPTPAPPAAPWRTVGTAAELQRAVAEAPAGSAVELRGGTYPDVSLATARTDWVTVRPAAGERVELAGLTFGAGAAFIRVEGLAVAGRVLIAAEGAHDIQVVGSHVARGIRAEWGSHDLLIEGNLIDRASTGVELISQNCTVHNAPEACPPSRSLPPVERVAIRNNRIVAPSKNGITLANYRAVVVEGNEISRLTERGQHSDALQSMWGGAGLVIRHNHIHDMTGNQGLFIKDGRVANVTIEDNLIVRTRPIPGYSFSGPAVSFYDTVPDPRAPYYTGHGIRIVRNTIWDNAHHLVIMGADNRRVQIHENVTEAIDISEATRAQVRAGGIDQDRNIVAGGHSWGRVGPDDVPGPPRFRDRAAGDYRITAAQARALGFRPGVTWAP